MLDLEYFGGMNSGKDSPFPPLLGIFLLDFLDFLLLFSSGGGGFLGMPTGDGLGLGGKVGLGGIMGGFGARADNPDRSI